MAIVVCWRSHTPTNDYCQQSPMPAEPHASPSSIIIVHYHSAVKAREPCIVVTLLSLSSFVRVEFELVFV